MLEFLPQNIIEGIKKINLTYLFEIRLRAEKPVTINYQGEYRYLSLYGLTDHKERAIRPTFEDIDEAVEFLTNCGAIEYARNLALESVDQAKEVLEILDDSSSKQVLVDIADFVLERSA